jgi:hypothetical protein
MAREDENIFDKAEGFARRLLERLGARVDEKIGGDDQTLSARQLSEVASRMEKAIEDNLREDERKVRRVAPNLFNVLLTYEEASRLSPKYKEALSSELRSVAIEHINNRRYETVGSVSVEIGSDLFSKTAVVKASFEETGPSPAGRSSDHRTITLSSSVGKTFKLVLEPGQDPACIGRASGIAARIDDPSLSRLHCSISQRVNGDVIISDLGSSNGTALNGKQLGPHRAHLLKPGDVLELGDVKLTVEEII